MNYLDTVDKGTVSDYTSSDESDHLEVLQAKMKEDVEMVEEQISTARAQPIIESQIFSQVLPLIGKIPMSKRTAPLKPLFV